MELHDDFQMIIIHYIFGICAFLSGALFFQGAMFLSKAPVPSSDIVTCPQGWRTVDQLREENGEKLAYERLKYVLFLTEL